MLKTVSSFGSSVGSLNYKGAWNASTNSPTLVSGSGTKGDYYVVSVAGTTNLDGINLWSVGDWAVFNGTAWQKVDGGTTESFYAIAVTSLTGYMYANGSNLVTASTTIPVANVSGAVPNTVNVLAGGLLSGGGALTGNVTISLANVPSGNVTGLGTMATQNANAVAITGGTIGNAVLSNANITSVQATFPNSYLTNSSVVLGNTTASLGSTISTINALTLTNVTVSSGNGTFANLSSGNVTITGGTENNVTYTNVTVSSGNATLTKVTANTVVAAGSISGNVSSGAFSYGNLSYSDTGIVASYANNANTYIQIVMQNTSNGSNASSDFALVNDTGTAYGDFGITSSTFSGSGRFYSANVVYLYSGSVDLVVGTLSANATHFVANNSATDAMTINSNNTVTIQTLAQSTSSSATFATSSLPLVPAGYIIVNNNGTNVKIPYYAV